MQGANGEKGAQRHTRTISAALLQFCVSAADTLLVVLTLPLTKNACNEVVQERAHTSWIWHNALSLLFIPSLGTHVTCDKKKKNPKKCSLAPTCNQMLMKFARWEGRCTLPLFHVRWQTDKDEYLRDVALSGSHAPVSDSAVNSKWLNAIASMFLSIAPSSGFLWCSCFPVI